MKNHPFSRLLSQKYFIYLWLSQVLSQLTVNLVTFSVITHIYSTTHSSLAVSIIWLCFSLPIFLFGPFSGGLVDRLNLKKTMIVTNILQGLSVLLLLVVGDTVVLIYAIVLFYSSIDRLYIPAQAAAVPWLVEKKYLSVANGLFFLTQQASILIGFGLGGLLVSLIGQPTTIGLSAIFLFIAAYAAFNLPRESPPRSVRTRSGLAEFISELIAGYSLLNQHLHLKFSFALFVFLQAYLTVIAVLLPSFANESLNLDFNSAAPLLIIPASLGALVSSFNLTSLLNRYRKIFVVEAGLFIIGFSLLAIAAASFLPDSFGLFISMLFAFTLGGAFAAAIIPANTFIQEHTPQEFSGRVYGLLGFFSTVATMLPLMLSASLADLFGSLAIFMGLGLFILAISIILKQKGARILHVQS